MEKNNRDIFTLIKEWSWHTYVMIAFLLISIGAVTTGYLTDLINNYLNDIFIHQAVSLGENYSTTIDLSTSANSTINDLFEERINIALEGVRHHLDDFLSNKTSIDYYSERFKVDEVFIFDENGTIVVSRDKEFLGWTLPANHPVSIIKQGDEKIVFDEIRQATETGQYYKYAYYNSSTGYLIQVGVLADNIYNFSRSFLPETLSEMIADDVNILHADFYFNDNYKQTHETEGNLETFDEFEEEAMQSDEVEYRFMDFNDERALQMFVPLYVNGKMIGHLVLYHSTTYHTLLIRRIVTFTSLSIFGIMAFIAFLLCLQYQKSKDIERISYYDPDTGINNRTSFNKYIQENFRKLRDENYFVTIILISNYSQLKLIKANDVDDIINEYIAGILEKSENREIAFRYYDDVFLLFYKDPLIVNFFNQKVNQSPSAEGLFDENIDIKAGLLEIDDRYSNSYEINANMIAAILELRNPETQDFTIFTANIWQGLIRHERILNDLRRTYLNAQSDEFYVVFQPQINRSLNRVIGFETLSRWNHPELGMISPNEFIQAAEKSNLIIPLGDKIIEDSLKFLQSLIAHGFDDITVSINISYTQLIQPHFCEKFEYQLKRANVPAELVGLEMTESKLIQDYENVNKALNVLRKIGVKIYIDDFGKGYSNFERLQNLNVDYLKIDHSLIKMIETDPTIVEAIFQITNGLHYDVIAEGVENIEQIKFLEKQNCFLFQGFYYEKALRKEDAIKYLQENYHPDK